MKFKLIALAGAAAASLAIAGCDRVSPRPAPPAAALPLTEIATGPLPLAPPVEALPPAPRPPLGRITAPRQHYGYIDRAYEVSDAFYDSPPDYAVYYDDIEPWIWRTDDDYYLVSEPYDAGWRYYYYEPGAFLPFLIRDPFYSYGYDRGSLVVVYDNRGQVLPDYVIVQRADDAGRYLRRGELLYQAAVTEPRRAIAVSQWSGARRAIEADRQRLITWQQAVPDWQSYRQTRAVQEGSRWDAERARRRAWTDRAERQLNRVTVAEDRQPNGRRGAELQAVQSRPTAPPIVQLRQGKEERRAVAAARQAELAVRRGPAVEARGIERGDQRALFDQRREEARRLQLQAQDRRQALDERRQLREADRVRVQAQAAEQRNAADLRGRQLREAQRAQIEARRADRVQDAQRARVEAGAVRERTRVQEAQRARIEQRSAIREQAVRVQEARRAAVQAERASRAQAPAQAAARQGANAAAHVKEQPQQQADPNTDKKAKRGRGD